jgi:hypothetical protein
VHSPGSDSRDAVFRDLVEDEGVLRRNPFNGRAVDVACDDHAAERSGDGLAGDQEGAVLVVPFQIGDVVTDEGFCLLFRGCVVQY